MCARWSTDGGPARAQRTAVDSGPCAAGRTGSVMVDAWVTPMSTRFTGPANGRTAASKVFNPPQAAPAGSRKVMSAVVPVAVVSSSIESLSTRINGKPRPPLPGTVAGGFHDP